MNRFPIFAVAIGLLLQLVPTGCSRNHYRLQADRETTTTLVHKTAHTPWSVPDWFSIYPHDQSRFNLPTNPNDPALPNPAPQLYAYSLPEIPQRDPNRFREQSPSDDVMLQPLRNVNQSLIAQQSAPSPETIDISMTVTASYQQEEPELLPLQGPNTSPPSDDATESLDTQMETDPEAPPAPYASSTESELIVVPIPRDVWQSLPESCLNRMFEFESVRAEYERSFNQNPRDRETNGSPKLALEDIVELSLINSREYQRQKEILYVAALRLTLERYAYQLRFDPFGNGTDVNYIHNRTAGITQNTLAIPTRLSGGKILATGGDLVARFANDVVLTFNGPAGFSADIGSELFFSLSQSVFQRDVVFENLTQSERNVIYAARDFARFRKTFFQDLASSYYALILTYRGIEIDSQNYFSNLRAYNQGEAEFGAGRLPRIQVDQFEQNALSARSSLIGRCNSLESGLDNLKLDIGIPPELPINLDLTELELLTLRDETTVSAELVRRARRILHQERNAESPDRVSLLNFAIDLTRRLLNLERLRAQLQQREPQSQQLDILLAEFLLNESQIQVQLNQDILAREQNVEPAAPPLRIFQRTTELIGTQLTLVRLHEDLLERRGQSAFNPNTDQTLGQLRSQLATLQNDLSKAIEQRQLQRLPQFVTLAEDLLTRSTALLRQSVPEGLQINAGENLQQILTSVDRLLTTSDEAIASVASGLSPITIAGDDAMLTAVSQRFDLMNQRGALADAWRQIKLAGDDLKSVLNLNASQSIRTDSTNNRPFDFAFDDSTTQLNLSFDAPLNRQAQRNVFRLALINYQVALRSLIALEDGIKLAIRDDLRDLQLDREQYNIAVASAALAYERVVSTRLQLQLGVENVAARDFLEAQQAYTASLSSVAREHIGYINDRIALFVDLELLQVDENGFWAELYQEELQPEPQLFPPCADGPYGSLPPQVWYSRKVRRMLDIPYGKPIIFDPGDSNTDRASSGRRGNQEEISLPVPQPIESVPDEATSSSLLPADEN